MFRVSKAVVLALLTAAWRVSAAAQQPQSTGGTHRSAWFSYFADHPFAPELALHLEGLYRRTLGLSQFEQVMLRPGLTIVESKGWQSLFAYTYFFSEPTPGGSFGQSPFIGRQVEHRAFEQQIFEHRLFGNGEKAVTLAHRTRLEQRWMGSEVTGGSIPNWRFSERARYRLTVHAPVGVTASPAHYIAAFNETYTDFGPHSQSSPFYADVTYAALGTRVRPHGQSSSGISTAVLESQAASQVATIIHCRSTCFRLLPCGATSEVPMRNTQGQW